MHSLLEKIDAAPPQMFHSPKQKGQHVWEYEGMYRPHTGEPRVNKQLWTQKVQPSHTCLNGSRA